jgi:APA family basic amino acid/polyamine antiporter
MLVFISLIRLRFVDPYTPRPYKVPLNVKWKRRDGDAVEIPLLGFLGFLGVGSIFLTVIITHEIGRVVGVAWILICLTYYLIFRRRNGLPLLGSVPHDWEKEQIEVLTNAEEFDSLEQYKQALIRRDRKLGVRSRWENEAPGA